MVTKQTPICTHTRVRPRLPRSPTSKVIQLKVTHLRLITHRGTVDTIMTLSANSIGQNKLKTLAVKTTTTQASNSIRMLRIKDRITRDRL